MQIAVRDTATPKEVVCQCFFDVSCAGPKTPTGEVSGDANIICQPACSVVNPTSS